MLDVEEALKKEYQAIYKAVTKQSLDIARLIHTHIEYEDLTWKIDRKPDYMAGSDMKFTNVFLSSLDVLLKWVQELLQEVPSETPRATTTDGFVVLHPTSAGLSMWHFNKTYHGLSIGKVKWFITTLAHLYNAAIRAGGLRTFWKDLDFIVEKHGSDRVFVGGPPVNPQDFLDRCDMSICISTRVLAKGFKLKGNYLPTGPAELEKTRGMMSYFPLEDTIAKYYGPDKDGD